MLQSLSTALTALSTAQSALSVVANNVANAATPGYTRQRVTLTNLNPNSLAGGRFSVGRGVAIGSLDRVANSLLNDQIRDQQSYVGRYGVASEFLGQLEALLGEPGGASLGDRTAGLFASLAALTGAPENSARRTDVVQAGTQLTDLFNLLARQVGNVQQDLTGAVQIEVREINNRLRELDSLNEALAGVGSAGGAPADFLDQQDRVLRDLANRIDVRVQRETDGRITLSSGNATLLSPGVQVDLSLSGVDQIDGSLRLSVGQSDTPFVPRGGRLKGLLDLTDGAVGTSRTNLDTLARNLALEFNRVFSTGVPSGGGYTSLTAANRFVDRNRSGSFLDETIENAGLPFDVRDGRLTVNVTGPDGAVRRTTIEIDRGDTRVGDLVSALDGITGLRAVVDDLGQLRVSSEGGYRFDFSNRVLPNYDLDGRFGSAQATAVGTRTNPISITAGSSFQIDVDGTGPQVVTIANAHTSLESLAAELNATLAPLGASALVAGGTLAIRSNGSGTRSSIALTDGANGPLAALGLSSALVTGGQDSVAVRFTGRFQDSSDRSYTFRPTGDGEIGVTPGLEVEVIDSNGQVIRRLNVGQGYTPGTELELFNGLSVSFDAGRVQASANHSFTATFPASSDTADVLSALGLGVFFSGSDAASLAVRPDLITDPTAFAAGLSDAAGDGSNLTRLSALASKSLSGLNQTTLDGFYQALVTDLGSESRRATSTRDSQQVVLDSLDDRRESISGVNLDEELLLLEQYQAMFEANARFLQVIQEVTDELLDII